MNTLKQLLSKPWQQLYVLDGDEPYLIQQASQHLQKAAKEQGYHELERVSVSKEKELAELHLQLHTHSLFSTNTLLIASFTTAKLGRGGLNQLKSLAQGIPQDKTLVCLFPKLDNSQLKSAWYKALSSTGASCSLRPLPAYKMPNWVRDQLRAAGMQADPDVVEQLIRSTEGNLSATAQEIEKLALIYGKTTLTQQQVNDAVANQAKFNVFQVIDSTLAGNAGRLLQTLRPLQQADREGILLLYLVIKELKRLVAIKTAISRGESTQAAMQPFRLWDAQKQRIGQALQRHSLAQLTQLLLRATELDLAFKGLRRQDPWQGLTHVLLSLASTPWALSGIADE